MMASPYGIEVKRTYDGYDNKHYVVTEVTLKMYFDGVDYVEQSEQFEAQIKALMHPVKNKASK